MALPTNRIKKVKLTNNTEYDIVPTMLQDGTTTNKLSVPTLSNDDNIVTTNTTQSISGSKTFTNVQNFESGLKIGNSNYDDVFSISVSQDNIGIINSNSTLNPKTGLSMHIPSNVSAYGYIIPNYTGIIDIGQTNTRFRNLYLGNNAYIDGTIYGNNGLQIDVGDATIGEGKLGINSDYYETYTGDDWDASFYADRIEIFNNDASGQTDLSKTTILQFPEFNGETKTFAVTSDLTELVDLTSVN